jgi:NDP-sugar pyrophosphorylase family protein
MTAPAAILCGGLGTRLGPLTANKPKALVEIVGEPFIAHQLRLLKASGVTRAVLCVGYGAEMIRDYVAGGARFGVTVDYCHDGPRLLGTAGALRKALPLLGDEFFVLYGDSYLPCDYAAVWKRFRESGKQALMTVYRNEGAFDTSNVELDSDGSIRAYDKKNRTPAMRHIDYGLGVFRSAAFERVPQERAFDLAELYQSLLAAGELAAFEVPDRFYEIGSLQGIADLTEYLSKR